MCTTTLSTKDVAVTFFSTALREFDAEKLKELAAEDYIQHNPTVPTGAAPFLGFLPALKESGLKATTHRVLADGDLVALHNEYEKADLFGKPNLGTFDILRIKDGIAVEHWDALQETVPKSECKSGRSVFDGPTEVTDLDKTEENKKLVKEFLETVLIGGQFDKLTDYISTETYHQHNPHIADGVTGVQEAFAAFAAAGQGIVYHKNHLLIGEGNFVLTMNEGTFGDKPTCFQDLFRIDNGKIVEHWDHIAEIPDKMAHENGMF